MVTKEQTRAAATRATLGHMIRWLAAQCDGARMIDGAGFAKNDVVIGHELAATPEAEWDGEMVSWAYSRARKHRRQLEGWLGAGAIEELEAPPEVGPQGGETWWQRQRREKREREEAARPRFEQPWEARARLRAERDALEAQKPKTVTVKGKSNQGLVEVRFDYPFSYETNDLIKAIPGRRFVNGIDAQMREDKHWSALITPATVPCIRGLTGHGFTLAPEVAAALEAAATGVKREADRARQNERASAATDAALVIPGLIREPYPFQRAGIAYAAREKRVLIGDEPGLGKTIQAIGTVQLLGAYPAVVVSPASVKYNWQREWDKTVAGKRVVVIDGKKPLGLPVYREADVIVVNYDVLGAHLLALKAETKPQAVIVDESHYIKNDRAQRSKAVHELAAGVEVRLALTGTPVLNKPIELLSQLTMLGRLGDVARDPSGQASPRWFFLKHFCAAYKDGWGVWQLDGADNLDELHRRLRQTCFVRRRKAEVLKELPPKTRTVIEVDLTNRREYDRAEADLVAHLAREAVEDADFKASLAGYPAEVQRALRLERWHSEAEKVKRAKQLIRFTELKQLAARGKLEAIKQWAGDFLDSGEKLVMFGWHREVVQMLADTFNAPTVMGGDNALKRQRAVDAFQTDPSVQAIACNIIAAGEGITLTAASSSMFAELGWNAGKMTQSEDRIHRIGQEADSVNIYYILGKDTIDGEIWQIIEDKRRVVDQVTDGLVPTGDQDEPVMQALIERLLAKAGVAKKGRK